MIDIDAIAVVTITVDDAAAAGACCAMCCVMSCHVVLCCSVLIYLSVSWCMIRLFTHRCV